MKRCDKSTAIFVLLLLLSPDYAFGQVVLTRAGACTPLTAALCYDHYDCEFGNFCALPEPCTFVSDSPTTSSPTRSPTGTPTVAPTVSPTTRAPTGAPTSRAPTQNPTGSPTGTPTASPTVSPTT
eukprot:2610758-Pyramimonas_sp.AAC.1